MTKLSWSNPKERQHYAGVDRGVIFPLNGSGVVWNGLIAVQDDSEVEVREGYFDGLKYSSRLLNNGFKATVECYSYPQELSYLESFSATRHKDFAFSYRVEKTIGKKTFHEIHLVPKATFKLSNRNFNSLSESADSVQFIFELTTKSEEVFDGIFASHLVVDTSMAYPWAVEEFESMLYGTDSTQPDFPRLSDVFNLFESNALLQIFDNGDGTWTADGPDYAIQMLDPTTFEIDWPSAVYIDTDTYTIKSL